VFGLHPRIFQKEQDRLEIRTSYVPRILFSLFAAFVLAGMIGGNAFSAVPLSIFGISLFSALYTDRWIFDKGKKRAEYHVGLPFLHLTRVIPFEDIERIEYSATTRASVLRSRNRRENAIESADPSRRWAMQTVYTQLKLLTPSRRPHMVGITSLEVKGETDGAARKIASLCEKPLLEA
jgi:hypothetical protein